jgi:hypothetical protein
LGLQKHYAGCDISLKIEPSKMPNQTPEPTSTAVTPDADASAAPSAAVAHL